jgi:hypothetical protein
MDVKNENAHCKRYANSPTHITRDKGRRYRRLGNDSAKVPPNTGGNDGRDDRQKPYGREFVDRLFASYDPTE